MTQHLFIVELDTGRFGDWIIVKATDEDDARRQARRRTRRPIRTVRMSRSTSEWLAERSPA